MQNMRECDGSVATLEITRILTEMFSRQMSEVWQANFWLTRVSLALSLGFRQGMPGFQRATFDKQR